MTSSSREGTPTEGGVSPPPARRTRTAWIKHKLLSVFHNGPPKGLESTRTRQNREKNKRSNASKNGPKSYLQRTTFSFPSAVVEAADWLQQKTVPRSLSARLKRTFSITTSAAGGTDGAEDPGNSTGDGVTMTEIGSGGNGSVFELSDETFSDDADSLHSQQASFSAAEENRDAGPAGFVADQQNLHADSSTTQRTQTNDGATSIPDNTNPSTVSTAPGAALAAPPAVSAGAARSTPREVLKRIKTEHKQDLRAVVIEVLIQRALTVFEEFVIADDINKRQEELLLRQATSENDRKNINRRFFVEFFRNKFRSCKKRQVSSCGEEQGRGVVVAGSSPTPSTVLSSVPPGAKDILLTAEQRSELIYENKCVTALHSVHARGKLKLREGGGSKKPIRRSNRSLATKVAQTSRTTANSYELDVFLAMERVEVFPLDASEEKQKVVAEQLAEKSFSFVSHALSCQRKLERLRILHADMKTPNVGFPLWNSPHAPPGSGQGGQQLLHQLQNSLTRPTGAGTSHLPTSTTPAPPPPTSFSAFTRGASPPPSADYTKIRIFDFGMAGILSRKGDRFLAPNSKNLMGREEKKNSRYLCDGTAGYVDPVWEDLCYREKRLAQVVEQEQRSKREALLHQEPTGRAEERLESPGGPVVDGQQHVPAPVVTSGSSDEGPRRAEQDRQTAAQKIQDLDRQIFLAQNRFQFSPKFERFAWSLMLLDVLNAPDYDTALLDTKTSNALIDSPRSTAAVGEQQDASAPTSPTSSASPTNHRERWSFIEAGPGNPAIATCLSAFFYFDRRRLGGANYEAEKKKLLQLVDFRVDEKRKDGRAIADGEQAKATGDEKEQEAQQQHDTSAKPGSTCGAFLRELRQGWELEQRLPLDYRMVTSTSTSTPQNRDVGGPTRKYAVVTGVELKDKAAAQDPEPDLAAADESATRVREIESPSVAVARPTGDSQEGSSVGGQEDARNDETTVARIPPEEMTMERANSTESSGSAATSVASTAASSSASTAASSSTYSSSALVDGSFLSGSGTSFTSAGTAVSGEAQQMTAEESRAAGGILVDLEKKYFHFPGFSPAHLLIAAKAVPEGPPAAVPVVPEPPASSSAAAGVADSTATTFGSLSLSISGAQQPLLDQEGGDHISAANSETIAPATTPVADLPEEAESGAANPETTAPTTTPAADPDEGAATEPAQQSVSWLSRVKSFWQSSARSITQRVYYNHSAPFSLWQKRGTASASAPEQPLQMQTQLPSFDHTGVGGRRLVAMLVRSEKTLDLPKEKTEVKNENAVDQPGPLPGGTTSQPRSTASQQLWRWKTQVSESFSRWRNASARDTDVSEQDVQEKQAALLLLENLKPTRRSAEQLAFDILAPLMLPLPELVEVEPDGNEETPEDPHTAVLSSGVSQPSTGASSFTTASLSAGVVESEQPEAATEHDPPAASSLLRGTTDNGDGHINSATLGVEVTGSGEDLHLPSGLASSAEQVQESSSSSRRWSFVSHVSKAAETAMAELKMVPFYVSSRMPRLSSSNGGRTSRNENSFEEDIKDAETTSEKYIRDGDAMAQDLLWHGIREVADQCRDQGSCPPDL
ncbi:unnamed protein product [Amoebophrya sp. A120]|nr:unnamed protein product [Amoebophrya sp. A120]|eukprot:GSA120T00019497001.1